MKISIPKWFKYILWVVGVYVLWFIIGIVLVETNVVKEFPLGFGGVIVDGHRNIDSSMADTDGPHLFYKGDTLITKQIVKIDTALLVKTDTFLNGAKNKIEIACTFSGDAILNFTTRLKDSLLIEPTEYPSPGRILAISDLEGEFVAFRALLIKSRVIDDAYNWIFGDGHLVLVGDFFDRGLHVTECLWLIYDLEQKAKEAGGYVHFILGNHEIMNMSGNLRYVRNKYIENTYLLRENYKKWYTPDTELGRWLQTKNIVEKIGDVLFLHGGISEEVSNLNLSLPEINNICRPYYFTADSARKSDDIRLKQLFDLQNSPFWFRDYIKEKVSPQQVDQVLAQYQVSKIVVGHSIVPTINSFYAAKVIGIDTKHGEGVNEALLIENSNFYKVNLTGNKYSIKQD